MLKQTQKIHVVAISKTQTETKLQIKWPSLFKKIDCKEKQKGDEGEPIEK